MSKFITKRRLVSLASASAVIATMALAAAPAATLASSCAPTGFIRDGIDLTAAQIGGPVTGELDAHYCDIGVYNPTSVNLADVHGARYFGVVVNGGTNVNTTNSKVHGIGEQPKFNGTQHGRAILYINGATGTISGNKVTDFQKNGIEVRGLTADGSAPSVTRTSATIANNVITGQGPTGLIAQNGIVVMGNAGATVKNNTISGLWYTGTDTYATGLLNVDVAAGRIIVGGNTFSGTPVRIDGAVTRILNVQGSSSIVVGPRSVRVDLRTVAQPVHTVIGNKLDWRIKVNGTTVFHVKEGFSTHDVYRQQFAAGSGRHVIKVFKNNVLVRTATVRA